MTDGAINYIEQERQAFLEQLKEYMAIPSVSADSKYKKDVLACANWLAGHLKGLGFDARIIETKGHPIVRADSNNGTEKRLLIYGHYDVQPADPFDKWDTKPFEPVIKDGIIYGRGATDDKGQLFAHIKAVESIVKTSGKLPCDLTFLIEGEEECGGDNLTEYIIKETDSLSCDAVVISDTAMYDEKTPALTYSLRGIIAFQIKVTTARADLHSGVYGGAAPNANMALSQLISKCVNADGSIPIEGFYEGIKPLDDWEKKNFADLKFEDKTILNDTGIKSIFGVPGVSTLERLWAMPSLDINGIFGGYTEEGMKTVIPCVARAKISVRLVPEQDPQKIARAVENHIKKVCPDYADVEIEGSVAAAPPVLFDTGNPMLKAGMNALKQGFGAEPVYIRCGGSIPVVNTFVRQIKKPVILMGFGLDSDGAHSANEKFKVANFINGIKSSVHLLANI